MLKIINTVSICSRIVC